MKRSDYAIGRIVKARDSANTKEKDRINKFLSKVRGLRESYNILMNLHQNTILDIQARALIDNYKCNSGRLLLYDGNNKVFKYK